MVSGMINNQKSLKFLKLRAKTAKSILDHKFKLTSAAIENKRYVGRFKSVLLESLFLAKPSYSIFVEIFFPTFYDKLELHVAELRRQEINYFFVTTSELRAFKNHAMDLGLNFAALREGSSLLVITLKNERAYRSVLANFLELERDSENLTFNNIQLFCVQESGLIISFVNRQLEIRKLYDLRHTQTTILLETLHTLNSSIFAITNLVDAQIKAVQAVPVNNLVVTFPFKC